MTLEIALTIVQGLWTFAKDIYSFRERLNKAKGESRTSLAAYFMNICNCIVDIADKVEKGEKTSGSCAKLGTYIDLLPSLLKDFLPNEVVNKLNDELQNARGVDSLYVLEANYPESERAVQVARLREAAGSLEAVADYLRTV